MIIQTYRLDVEPELHIAQRGATCRFACIKKTANTQASHYTIFSLRAVRLPPRRQRRNDIV